MTMRAFLVLLVVLNLGAAAWWLLHTDAPATETAEPPSGVARLSLVSEHPELRPAPAPAAVDDAVAPSAAEPAVAADVPPPPPPPSNDTCLRLGPFADAAAAGQAQTALRGGATRLAIREQAQPAGRDRGWRVYLPPAADRSAADAAAGRLRAAGFTDLLVVGNGTEANSIALGRFSTEDRARQHAAALRAAGFEAKAEALGETRSAFWVELAVAGPADAGALRRRVGAAQARPMDCEGQR
jgi:cell division septation protein DedD